MSFFGALKTAANPLTGVRAAMAVARNPFNPLAQTNALKNLFTGGGSAPASPAPYPMAPGYGAPFPGQTPPPGYPPGFPPQAYPSFAPPQSYGPPSGGFPPPGGGYGGPPGPMPGYDLGPQYAAPPAQYGGDTGWEASYGQSDPGAMPDY